MKNKKLIALLCFLADAVFAFYSYLKIKNYDEYTKMIKPMIDSPDFQVQFYAVFLQSFIFSMLLFLSFHLIIYILFVRESKYAIKYVRFYTIMAALSSAIMVFTGVMIGIVPLFIYTVSYFSIKKLLKTSPTPSNIKTPSPVLKKAPTGINIAKK